MIQIKYVFLTLLYFTIANIIVWYQLNSQLVWKWAEGTKSMLWMSLLGIPISILFWYCTKYGYLGFGNLWSVRFMGFAASMITFPIMTYFYLGEPMTLKVWVTMGLAIIIMIIQLY
jgi:1,4-dihydroxy-2-naphthoate octaprenyltransferase